jgi:hypothetical protein
MRDAHAQSDEKASDEKASDETDYCKKASDVEAGETGGWAAESAAARRV